MTNLNTMLSRKPLPKQPCNHCGWCCSMEICRLGEHALSLFNKQAAPPCPFLKETAPLEFKCRIILSEQAAGESDFADMLGISKGCCSTTLIEVFG